jgi:hypothetical protein
LQQNFRRAFTYILGYTHSYSINSVHHSYLILWADYSVANVDADISHAY